jgi:hypothetical protein
MIAEYSGYMRNRAVASWLPKTAGLLQRSCSDCPKKQKLLQRRAVSQPEPASVPPIIHEVLRIPGQPLDAATRSYMESIFSHDFSRVRSHSIPQAASLTIGPANDGYEQEAERASEEVIQRSPASSAKGSAPGISHDFSNVHVHTGSKAAESARAAGAHAYTVGQSIVFGEGRYAPKTAAGQRLLAHELAHVVQQQHGTKLIQRQVGSEPDECNGRGPADSEDHPLIYNCQDANNLGRPEQERCKRPAVGHAQQLLNEFLRRYDNWKSGVGGDTIACAGGCSAQIESLRNTLPLQLKVDCWFGDLTYRATRMFQLCDGGLKDDGKIGEKTWPALESMGGSGTPPTKIPPTVIPPIVPPGGNVPPLIPFLTDQCWGNDLTNVNSADKKAKEITNDAIDTVSAHQGAGMYQRFFMTGTPNEAEIQKLFQAIKSDFDNGGYLYICEQCPMPVAGAGGREYGYVLGCGSRSEPIHICTNFLNDIDEIAVTIVHEFAHRNGACYYPEFYCCSGQCDSQLTPDNALRNADSYSSFAAENNYIACKI